MLNVDILKMIYFAFVHSHLVYGIEIYANTHMKNVNKLVILNNKILRILQNVSRDIHTVELYTKFNTLPIPPLHNCHLLTIMISCQLYSQIILLTRMWANAQRQQFSVAESCMRGSLFMQFLSMTIS